MPGLASLNHRALELLKRLHLVSLGLLELTKKLSFHALELSRLFFDFCDLSPHLHEFQGFLTTDALNLFGEVELPLLPSELLLLVAFFLLQIDSPLEVPPCVPNCQGITRFLLFDPLSFFHLHSMNFFILFTSILTSLFFQRLNVLSHFLLTFSAFVLLLQLKSHLGFVFSHGLSDFGSFSLCLSDLSQGTLLFLLEHASSILELLHVVF